MYKTCNKDTLESLPTGIYEIPGEPAVLINGLPPISSTDDNLFPCPVVNEMDSNWNMGFGEWLVGREVQKLFGELIYRGEVTEFDQETGWYRVVYEDGDVEDLDWNELEEVLQPLDISVPLKTVAMKVVRKKHKKSSKRKSRTRSVDLSVSAVEGEEKKSRNT